MKLTFFSFSVLFLMGCTVAKNASNTSFIPKKLVFENYSVSEKQDAVQISKQNDFIDSLYDPSGEDSLENRALKEITFSNLWSETPATKLILEIVNDSIWRHIRQDGIMIGDYTMILKSNSGIIHYYNKSKQFNYRNYDLFENRMEYKFEMNINRNDRKIILGYDCYKLILVRRDNDISMGNTTYEMYVTDKIDLPAHSVAFGIDLQPGLSPLEVSIKESFLPSVTEVYRLIEIE